MYSKPIFIDLGLEELIGVTDTAIEVEYANSKNKNSKSLEKIKRKSLEDSSKSKGKQGIMRMDDDKIGSIYRNTSLKSIIEEESSFEKRTSSSSLMSNGTTEPGEPCSSPAINKEVDFGSRRPSTSTNITRARELSTGSIEVLENRKVVQFKEVPFEESVENAKLNILQTPQELIKVLAIPHFRKTLERYYQVHAISALLHGESLTVEHLKDEYVLEVLAIALLDTNQRMAHENIIEIEKGKVQEEVRQMEAREEFEEEERKKRVAKLADKTVQSKQRVHARREEIDRAFEEREEIRKNRIHQLNQRKNHNTTNNSTATINSVSSASATSPTSLSQSQSQSLSLNKAQSRPVSPSQMMAYTSITESILSHQKRRNELVEKQEKELNKRFLDKTQRHTELNKTREKHRKKHIQKLQELRM
eukprot:gene3125-6146_t